MGHENVRQSRAEAHGEVNGRGHEPPPDNPPLVSIVIPVYDRYEYTRRCLRTVEGLSYPNLETIVVDNASPDDTSERLPQEFPGVRLRINPRNEGFAAGCNRGIRESSGTYILLLNNDTQLLDPNLIEVLAEALGTDPELAAVGPRIVDYEHHDTIVFDGAGDPFGNIDISGAAFLVRREALNAVGLLDESFFMYYEDRDLFARLTEAGWSLRHIPSVRVAHAVSGTSEPGSPFYYYWHNRNLLIYARRHLSLGRLAFRVLPAWLPANAWVLRRVLTRHDWRCLRAWLRGFRDGIKPALQDAGTTPIREGRDGSSRASRLG